MTIVYIGVGSNLNNPKKQVQTAITNLTNLPVTTLLKYSSLYQSQPLGQKNQPNYINAVTALETTLQPYDLLEILQELERQQGRQKNNKRWDARIIDLDILLYGNSQIQNDNLMIPHPQLTFREFVLYPLAEIAKNLILPTGESILTLKARCSIRNIKKLHQ